MSSRTVVAVVGLSGVGKSTLLKNARRRVSFEYLQASNLIKAEQQARLDELVAHDLLREKNIHDNQALLISGFIRNAPKEGLVVLDGHTVIDYSRWFSGDTAFSFFGYRRFSLRRNNRRR